MATDRNNQISNVADKVIQNYKDDVFERFRIIYNVHLKPFQWEWFFLMDIHPDVMGEACPRPGKTFVIQMKNLDENVINPNENEMVFAPKLDQAVNTRSVQNKVIEKSDVLKAYLKRNPQGKWEFGQTSYEFMNNSTSRCFGCLGNFEGENATKEHIDEADDIPPDQFKRIFGRSTGANDNGLPTRIRISGVRWGRLNMYRFENEGRFFVLPKVDVYLALENNWLDEEKVKLERLQMTDEEWLVTYCLEDVEIRNFIWSSHLKISQFIGLKWDVYPVPPRPGVFPKGPDDKIAFGLDMGAQGEGEDSSDYALTVELARGKYRRRMWCRTWPPDTAPETIITDICTYWKFYRPNGGYADSRDANLTAQINTRLYELGLVHIHWTRLGDNSQEGWAKWAKRGLLTPLHNQGRTKHNFYTSLKQAINNCRHIADLTVGRVLIFPQLDRKKAENLDHWKELQITLRELENLQAEKTAGGYLKISRIKKKIEDPKLKIRGSSRLGDDRADSLGLSNYFLDYLDPKARNGSGYSVAYIEGI